jgi:NAD(P)-dependent dehydrogenase (short-subunit alcohol dehydrogenase family)
MICRTTVRAQHVDVPGVEVAVAMAAGPELFRLDGRVALLTGGGGAIGSAVAQGFAAAGAAILIADRNPEAAEATVAALKAAGADAVAATGDVTSEDDVARTVDAAMARWGRIDVLMNAAGIGARHIAETYPLDRWKQVLDINLTGTFLFCRDVGQRMLAAGSGSIINIASIAGLVGYRGNPAYLSSKGGVVQLTRALAAEWATRGVRVNAIAPGVIDTQMVAGAIEREPEFYDEFKKKHAMNRFGTADELVGPALFLASDAASYVTGHILAVDGGYVAI